MLVTMITHTFIRLSGGMSAMLSPPPVRYDVKRYDVGNQDCRYITPKVFDVGHQAHARQIKVIRLLGYPLALTLFLRAPTLAPFPPFLRAPMMWVPMPKNQVTVARNCRIRGQFQPNRPSVARHYRFRGLCHPTPSPM